VLTDTEPTFALVGAPYLEYLPVVDLSTGRLLGMEALVRWHHPTHGLISPSRLIPHAEVSGDIGPLTRWILMEACERARHWSPSIQLGVNCTIHQLRRGEVSKAVANALEQTGLRSGQLTLEVTEDAIVDSSAAADLKYISEMGVQLSVDDVGTNWSSFEPFKRNSVSTVKIDGSFIAGLESTQGINRLVVETVIHMAHSLGMSTIVEWVETATQVEIVRSFGADAAQGFFFSRPMSSEDAVAFAGGSDVPQFSRSATRSLVVPDGSEHRLISLDGDLVGHDSGPKSETGTGAEDPDDAVVPLAPISSGPDDQAAGEPGAETPEPEGSLAADAEDPEVTVEQDGAVDPLDQVDDQPASSDDAA
jgi:EAL domain-containing protein (putative c-di-GMP-specific phosphodiesterase class I)